MLIINDFKILFQRFVDSADYFTLCVFSQVFLVVNIPYYKNSIYS